MLASHFSISRHAGSTIQPLVCTVAASEDTRIAANTTGGFAKPAIVHVVRALFWRIGATSADRP
jgi:hypothetical protein